MSYKRKIPWTRQPQTPLKIDRSNPLGRNITHCLPLNGDNREIVTGTTLSLGAAASNLVDVRGRSLKSAGAAACASIPLDLSPYTKASVSFWLYWDAFANDDALAMEYSSNYNASDAFIVDPNAANGTFGVYASGAAGAYQGGDIARPSAAAWHHYVLLFDRTTGTTLGTKVFVDTVLQTLTSPAGQEIPDNFANSTLYLFSRNNASLFGAGRMQNLVVRGGYLLSAAEAKAEYDNPWLIFEPLKRNIYVEGAASGGQTLTPSLYTDGDTFYAATVTPGAVALTPSLVVDADTFYAPTVSPGAVNLAPSLYTDADTFYAPTVTPGAVTLTPALYVDADTFYAASVVVDGGPQTILPALYADPDTFYAASVTGTVNLAPSLYTDADAFYAATVAASYNLQPAAYADADTFYSAVVSQGGAVLQPSLFSDPDTFYSATVSSAVFLSAPRKLSDHTQTARRSNKQTARRP